MKRTILLLPLLLFAAALCAAYAVQTRPPAARETVQTTDAPLLELTAQVNDRTVTLKVCELDEDGYARYALLHADAVRRSTYRSAWIAALGSGMATLPKKSP